MCEPRDARGRGAIDPAVGAIRDEGREDVDDAEGREPTEGVVWERVRVRDGVRETGGGRVEGVRGWRLV